MPQRKFCFFVLQIALFLTSCDRVIAGGSFSSASPEKLVSKFSGFPTESWFFKFWVLPALFIWVYGRFDRPETTRSGHTSGGEPVYLETGRIIPGDPSLADFGASLWLIGSPVGFFYYISIDTLPLTGFPNIDWILFKIIFPLIIFAFIYKLVDVIRKSPFFIFRWLTFCWKMLFRLVGIACLVLLFMSFIMYLVSWLFHR